MSDYEMMLGLGGKEMVLLAWIIYTLFIAAFAAGFIALCRAIKRNF